MDKQQILRNFLAKAQKKPENTPVKPTPHEPHEVELGNGVKLIVPKGEKGDNGVTPVLGKDYFTDSDIEQFKEAVTPVYKQDYLTDDELNGIKQEILEAATPQKGIHYNDGLDGEDGISPDPNEIARIVLSQIPEPIAGERGRDGKDADPAVVITKIKQLKGNDRLDISNIRNGEQISQALAGVSTLHKRINTLDERWHGGGLSGISYNGTSVTTGATAINFTGSGVSSVTADAYGVVTVTLSGGGSSGLVIGTTTITGGSTGQVLTIGAGGVLSSATPSGTGTVTSVSVVSANGLAGTVATATTTPAITLSTTVTGLIKGNGTAFSAATAGTDYQIPISLTTTGTSGAATFNTGTGALNIPQYQGAITLTTTGTSGAATLIGTTLNIPQYAGTTYTAGTGLTLSGGAFSVNTSQNITTLSNLTTAGFVQTTSGGVLSSAALTSGQVTTALGFTPGTGNGTVTSVSVVSANGFAGTVATSTTTPAITISTSVTGVIKGNGTAISAAVAGTDYETLVVKNIAQTAHGFSVGNILKLSGSTYALAKADSAADAEVVGIVSTVIDANDFSLTSIGYVTGLSGLTAGTTYFLSPTTAGALTATEPTTTGQIDKPLFISDSTTSGYFFNFRGITVSPASGTNYLIESVGATFDGGSSVISVGKTVYIVVPYACTINSVTIIANASGSAVFGIAKSSYSGFPTTTSIVASDPPTLSSAQKSQDTTLTGWTTTINAGDVLAFSVTSASTITYALVELSVTKS